MNDQWLPLATLPSGKVGMVRQLDGGRGLVGRLASLGFSPGVAVQMLQNFGRGPLIVLVRDTRVALGRGQAMKIWISQKGSSDGREKS